jgi:hypothetical protein
MLLGIALLLAFATTLIVSACEPGGRPIIENQRNHEVKILVTTVWTDGAPKEPNKPRDYGVVPARSTKQLAGITFVRREWVYRIEAVDPDGKSVFSKDFNMNDLDRISWRIVIPP